MNEQWKTDGICIKCRRYKYCSNRCKAYQKAMDAEITKLIYKKTGLGKILSHIINEREI